MARIPTYDSSVQIEPKNVISRAESIDSIGNLFSGVTQTIARDYQRRQIVKAEQEGAIAGEDPNFKQSQGFGQATEVYNNAALQSQKYTLGSDILLNTNKIYENATTNINDESSSIYKKNFDAYASQVLQHTDDRNIPYIKNILNHEYISGASKIQNKLLNNAKQDAAYVLDKNLITYGNKASNAAREGNINSALSFLGQQKTMLNGAISAGFITPKAAAIYATQSQKDVIEQHVIGQYEKSLNNGSGSDFIKNFEKSNAYDSSLSADQKDILVKKLEGLGKQHLQELGITQQSINDTKKDILFKAKNGSPVPPSQLSIIAESEPDNYNSFIQDVQRAELQGQVVQSAKFSTVENIKSTIDALKIRPTQSELTKDSGLKDYNNRLEIANNLQSQLSDFNNDPAGFTENDPLYFKAKEDFNQYGKINLPEEMIKIQKQRGLPDSKIRVIPNAVAAKMVGAINQMPLASQVGALQSIQQTYGPSAYYAMRDLAHSGLSQATQILVNMPNDTLGAALYPSALKALSTDTKILEDNLPSDVKKSDVMKKVKNNLSPYLNTIATYNGVPQDFINNVTNQVYKTALLLHANGDRNAEYNAANAMINNHYIFDSLNGYNYRIPVEYNNNKSVINEAANTAIISLKYSDLKIPSFYTYRLQGIPENKIQSEYKRLIQPHFITSPNEDSLIMVDSSGAPILKIDGSQFIINFNNANDFINSNKKYYNEYLTLSSAASRLPVLAAFEGGG